MTTSNEKKLDLKTAYAVETPQDSIDLYSRWADTYDADFAAKNDYRNPQQVADAFAKRCGVDNLPILDVGAGTGLVGAALAGHQLAPIDAIDISPEMLEVAMAKGCYRASLVADLTQRLDIADAVYGGIVCVGTFTHGHVGPEAIDELIRVARSGALFVLGINAKVYENGGFKAKFAAHSATIRDFEILTFQTYGENASTEMQAARSSVAVFTKR